MTLLHLYLIFCTAFGIAGAINFEKFMKTKYKLASGYKPINYVAGFIAIFAAWPFIIANKIIT